MAGFRAYFEDLKGAAPGGKIRLSPEESRHLCGALRARKGDIADVFDLGGAVMRCEIEAASARCAELRALEALRPGRAGGGAVLAQCMPKGGVFEDIISASVQIGVRKIVPVISERCVVRLSGAEAEAKAAKWRARIVESVKQSANFDFPEICAPLSFAGFMASAGEVLGRDCVRIVASLDAENPRPLLSALEAEAVSSPSACVLVGPEGDLSPEEYASAYAAGFAPASLGGCVMKSGVAACFSMSVCAAFFAAREGPSAGGREIRQ